MRRVKLDFDYTYVLRLTTLSTYPYPIVTTCTLQHSQCTYRYAIKITGGHAIPPRVQHPELKGPIPRGAVQSREQRECGIRREVLRCVKRSDVEDDRWVAKRPPLLACRPPVLRNTLGNEVTVGER